MPPRRTDDGHPPVDLLRHRPALTTTTLPGTARLPAASGIGAFTDLAESAPGICDEV